MADGTIRATRIGLMVPANNTTMERELLAWLPAGSTCATVRVPRGKGLLTRETIPDYKAQALSLADRLVERGPELIAYGCTAASFLSGRVGDEAFARELAGLTGRPVVTTAQAMVGVLREAAAGEIALVTPYAAPVNDALKAYLADSGIRVKRFASFDAADVEALGRIGAAEVEALASATMNGDCDALFIACSQLPTWEIVEGLRERFGRPVWSSVQATAHVAARMAAGA